MSDPKPDVMVVDGGFVSREACIPGCPCDIHGFKPHPDWEQEARRLEVERDELREALWGIFQNRMADDQGRCEPPCGECSQCLAREALQESIVAAGNGPPFNETGQGVGGVATEQKLSPWGGYPLCLRCEGALDPIEVSEGGVCESCQQVTR